MIFFPNILDFSKLVYLNKDYINGGLYCKFFLNFKYFSEGPLFISWVQQNAIDS
jgi:hypothetical protein